VLVALGGTLLQRQAVDLALDREQRVICCTPSTAIA
jgi:hypothetical protein